VSVNINVKNLDSRLRIIQFLSKHRNPALQTQTLKSLNYFSISSRLFFSISAILERIEDAASSALERNIEHEGTSSLFSADLERSYTGVEDDVPDVHEERWTDLGRPWSRSYSKFRRILKKLLRAQDVDEETVEHAQVVKNSENGEIGVILLLKPGF